jgi:hypothetical protein
MMNQLRTKYYDFSADMLMGSNEVPTNNSTAMGTATFNNTTKVFTITVTHDHLLQADTSIKELLEQMEACFPFTALVSQLVIQCCSYCRTRGRPYG